MEDVDGVVCAVDAVCAVCDDGAVCAVDRVVDVCAVDLELLLATMQEETVLLFPLIL